VSAFLQINPCKIFVEPDLEKPEHRICKLRLIAQLPATLSEMAGDIVDNLRASLDHAMYGVAVASGCKKPLNAYFPFSRTAANFEANLKGRCADVPQQIYPLLRSYQPYKGGSKPLWALNEVCVANKHKLLIPIGAAAFSAGMNVHGTRFTIPYTPVWDRGKNEMILATLGPGAEFKGHVDTGVYVAFGEIDSLDGRPAIEALDFFVRMVETILREIEAETRRLGFIS
jgi:hypothetical protein